MGQCSNFSNNYNPIRFIKVATETENTANHTHSKLKEKVFAAVRKGDVSQLIDIQKNSSTDIDFNYLITEDGFSLLHLAVIYNHADMVHFLLINGADINLIDKSYKRTPLHWAFSKSLELRNHVIVHCLIKAYELQSWLQIEANDTFGHFKIVSMGSTITCFNTDFSRLDETDKKPMYHTPLNDSSNYESENFEEATENIPEQNSSCDELINDSDQNQGKNEEKPARYQEFLPGDSNTLLVDVNSSKPTLSASEELLSLLQSPKSHNKSNLQELFLQSDINESVSEELQYSKLIRCDDLLHKLIKTGDVNKVQNLADYHKVDIQNYRFLNSLTPLHVAVIHDQYTMAKYLIEEMACNIFVTDLAGRTPFDWARICRNQRMINLFQPIQDHLQLEKNGKVSPVSDESLQEYLTQSELDASDSKESEVLVVKELKLDTLILPREVKDDDSIPNERSTLIQSRYEDFEDTQKSESNTLNLSNNSSPFSELITPNDDYYNHQSFDPIEHLEEKQNQAILNNHVVVQDSSIISSTKEDYITLSRRLTLPSSSLQIDENGSNESQNMIIHNEIEDDNVSKFLINPDIDNKMIVKPSIRKRMKKAASKMIDILTRKRTISDSSTITVPWTRTNSSRTMQTDP